MRKSELNTTDVLYWTRYSRGQNRPARLLDLELTEARRDRSSRELAWKRADPANNKPGRNSGGSVYSPAVDIGYPALALMLDEPGPRTPAEVAEVYAKCLQWLRDTTLTYADVIELDAELPDGIEPKIVVPRELEGRWDEVVAARKAERDARRAERQRKEQADQDAKSRYSELRLAAETLGVALPDRLDGTDWRGRRVVSIDVDTLAALMKMIPTREETS